MNQINVLERNGGSSYPVCIVETFFLLYISQVPHYEWNSLQHGDAQIKYIEYIIEKLR